MYVMKSFRLWFVVFSLVVLGALVYLSNNIFMSSRKDVVSVGEVVSNSQGFLDKRIVLNGVAEFVKTEVGQILCRRNAQSSGYKDSEISWYVLHDGESSILISEVRTDCFGQLKPKLVSAGQEITVYGMLIQLEGTDQFYLDVQGVVP